MTLSGAWLCFILYLALEMGLHYLTFMERNLENKKNLIQVMNNASMNNKNIMNSLGIFNDVNNIFKE